mmetsp:Transcript_13969/g.35354  ORF Transcript_13969/g.35354 Transcript_13969/m.35354 type:complete len:348 (+) Transcript_13969:635-1678(+)
MLVREGLGLVLLLLGRLLRGRGEVHLLVLAALGLHSCKRLCTHALLIVEALRLLLLELLLLVPNTLSLDRTEALVLLILGDHAVHERFLLEHGLPPSLLLLLQRRTGGVDHRRLLSLLASLLERAAAVKLRHVPVALVLELRELLGVQLLGPLFLTPEVRIVLQDVRRVLCLDLFRGVVLVLVLVDLPVKLFLELKLLHLVAAALGALHLLVLQRRGLCVHKVREGHGLAVLRLIACLARARLALVGEGNIVVRRPSSLLGHGLLQFLHAALDAPLKALDVRRGQLLAVARPKPVADFLLDVGRDRGISLGVPLRELGRQHALLLGVGRHFSRPLPLAAAAGFVASV